MQTAHPDHVHTRWCDPQNCPEAPPKTLEEYLAEGYTMWDNRRFSAALGMARNGQTLRRAMWRRNKHIREDAERRGVPLAEGRPDPKDIPAPDCYRHKPPRAQPWWDADRAKAWARQRGYPITDPPAVSNTDAA